MAAPRRSCFRSLVHCAVIAALVPIAVGHHPAVHPASTYPNKAIRWIVPFPAGSLLDIRSRFIARRLEDGLGSPVVVDNRPGAGGIMGTHLAATAAADGYTIALGTITGIHLD